MTPEKLRALLEKAAFDRAPHSPLCVRDSLDDGICSCCRNEARRSVVTIAPQLLALWEAAQTMKETEVGIQAWWDALDAQRAALAALEGKPE